MWVGVTFFRVGVGVCGWVCIFLTECGWMLVVVTLFLLGVGECDLFLAECVQVWVSVTFFDWVWVSLGE